MSLKRGIAFLRSQKPKYDQACDSGQSSPAKSSASFPTDGKSMSLEYLVDNYGDHIPLCFKVDKGFLAENEKDPTIDVDDVYNAHLVKHTEVVTLEDRAGDEYTVPLYSSAMFGVVYEGTKQSFASVGEIIDAVPVPKVVVAKSAFDGGAPTSSVIKNEVFVIIEVHKPQLPHAEKSWLNVFSVTNSEEKWLFRECEVKFTTDPRCTKLYVNDLIQYVPNLLPCKIRLFQDSETTVSLPQQLTSQEVLLKEKRRNTSIVVSLVRESGIRKENDFIDIPTSIGIGVTIVDRSSHRQVYDNLYIETSTLKKDFDSTKIQPCVDARTDDTYVTQAQLFSEVRKEVQSNYQELIFSTRDPIGPYEPVSYDNKDDSVITAPTTNHRPVPLKRSTSHTKNTSSPINSQTSASEQATHFVLPPIPPKTQSLPQNLPKTTEDGQPSVTSCDEHSPTPVSKPKKKPLPLPGVAQPEDQHYVDVIEPVSIYLPSDYEDISFHNNEPKNIDQVKKVNSGTTPKPTASQRPVPLKRNILPNKSASPVQSQAPQGATNHYDKPRAHSQGATNHYDKPRAQSLSQTVSKEREGDISLVDKNSKDKQHPQKPAVKPKKKAVPLPLPGAVLPNTRENVDVNEQLKRLQSSVDELSSRVKKLEAQLQQQSLTKTDSYKDGPSNHTQWQDLSSFNCTKVQQLLEVMKLNQYKEAFAKENIDGEVLKELSEEDLANELGVMTKIHRLRLMKIIRGSVSARDILTGRDTV